MFTAPLQRQLTLKVATTVPAVLESLHVAEETSEAVDNHFTSCWKGQTTVESRVPPMV